MHTSLCIAPKEVATLCHNTVFICPMFFPPLSSPLCVLQFHDTFKQSEYKTALAPRSYPATCYINPERLYYPECVWSLENNFHVSFRAAHVSQAICIILYEEHQEKKRFQNTIFLYRRVWGFFFFFFLLFEGSFPVVWENECSLYKKIPIFFTLGRFIQGQLW